MRRARWWERRRWLRQAAVGAASRRERFIERELFERTVAVVARDLVATLRWTPEHAGAVVWREAENKARIDCWGDDVGVAFPLAVAEDVQQALHDTFEDTTWPACRVHGRHPLWLAEDAAGGWPVWRCPADGSSHGRLGELPERDRPTVD